MVKDHQVTDFIWVVALFLLLTMWLLSVIVPSLVALCCGENPFAIAVYPDALEQVL